MYPVPSRLIGVVVKRCSLEEVKVRANVWPVKFAARAFLRGGDLSIQSPLFQSNQSWPENAEPELYRQMACEQRRGVRYIE